VTDVTSWSAENTRSVVHCDREPRPVRYLPSTHTQVSAFKVTTLWRYTNMFITITIMHLVGGVAQW